MIYLDQPGVWWLVYGIAIAAGGLGGLVAELLLQGAAGKLERTRVGKRFIDLGFWANVIVGAVAASAALAFLDPEAAGTEAAPREGYAVRMLVGVSLIVASAGGAAIAALQERVFSALKLERAQALAQVAEDALRDVQEEAAAQGSATEQTLHSAVRRIESARHTYDAQ